MVPFVWTSPKSIEHDKGSIRFAGWRNYAPTRVPAMWLRIAGLFGNEQGWLAALEGYGPLTDAFDDRPREEEVFRHQWQRTIDGLDAVKVVVEGDVASAELGDECALCARASFVELAYGLRRWTLVKGRHACGARGRAPLPMPA